MYNNKQYRTAQKSFQEGFENIKEYLGNVAGQTKAIAGGLLSPGVKEVAAEHNLDEDKIKKHIATGEFVALSPFIQDLLHRGYDLTTEFGTLLVGDLAINRLFSFLMNSKKSPLSPAMKKSLNLIPAPKVPLPIKPGLPDVKQPSKLLTNLKSGLTGGAAWLGTKALLDVAENAKGDLAIYKDYMSDYIKDLEAISKLYPKDENIQILINVMKRVANKGLKIIEDAKMTKTSQNKNYRIAIVGEANWGSYGRQFLEGAAFGAGSTKTWQGALGSGLGFAVSDAAKDVFHKFLTDDDYKATAYAAELGEKAKSMANQVKKYNPGYAATIRRYTEEFENYFRKYVFSPNKLEKFRDQKLFGIKKIETPHILLGEIELIKQNKGLK
jgi:hypothetical protein